MTVENLFAQFAILDNRFDVTFTPESNPVAEFEIALCRKQFTLSDVPIDQFWMAQHSLYGQRNQHAVNLDPLVDFYWAYCGVAGTQGDARVQESYLLEKILPHARSNGSRRVFIDSHQTVPGNRSRRLRVWTNELNRLLTASRNNEYDELEFSRATADMIGPPVYPDEVWRRYEALSAELFEEALNRIDSEGVEATERVLSDWQRMVRSMGRGRGSAIETQVLDVLSYECRAALHRCYSAVWNLLLDALGNRFAMTDESYIFHLLWNSEHSREGNLGDQAYFHLFHGHVFGLHPACGPVLLTQCGSELFADWLREGTRQSYHRVLHALTVAVGYYAQQHNITALLRQNSGSTESVGDMGALEEQQASRRQGRRPRHRSDD